MTALNWTPEETERKAAQSERKRVRRRQWYAENKDRVLRINDQWRVANLEKVRETNRNWRLSNKEKSSGYGKKWYDNNPDKVREKWLNAKYGITIVEFDRMFEWQGKCCAICKSKEPRGGRGKWCVDHDPGTNEVRGILCHNCNTGIGFLKHNKEILTNSISYLTSNWSTKGATP